MTKTDRWRPIRLDLGALPARRRREYDLVDIYRAVDIYRREYLAGRRSTDRLYRAFARGRAQTPTLATILKVAPLRDLLREVEQPDWEERVFRYPDPRVPTPEQQARKQRDRAAKKAAKPGPQAVLDLIRTRGSASTPEIAEHLEFPIWLVRHYLVHLRRANLIEFTAPPRSRQQRYVLTNGRTSDAAETRD